MTYRNRDWTQLITWCRDRFGEIDTIPCVVIPWGQPNQGLMIDYEDDHWRVGIYDDLGAEDVYMLYLGVDEGVEQVIWTVTYLTDNQPEGTDWAAWAAQRLADGAVS
jgi:hypothetical protein